MKIIYFNSVFHELGCKGTTFILIEQIYVRIIYFFGGGHILVVPHFTDNQVVIYEINSWYSCLREEVINGFVGLLGKRQCEVVFFPKCEYCFSRFLSCYTNDSCVIFSIIEFFDLWQFFLAIGT